MEFIFHKVLKPLLKKMLPTIIYQHRKENLKKCTLTHLKKRDDFIFFTYPNEELPDLTGYVILTMDAPLLTTKDKNKGIVIIDGTWKYANIMLNTLEKRPNLEYRSLPANYCTAYPRKQTDCPDPKTGLASIEAIYIAYIITNRNVENLLTNYYWKEDFLKKNNLN